jgi:hypothetical protein
LTKPGFWLRSKRPRTNIASPDALYHVDRYRSLTPREQEVLALLVELLTPDNCVVAFIDHQPQMLFGTSNFRPAVDHQQHGRPRQGSADFRRAIAEDEIKNLESVLTIVGGKPVYAAEEFAELAPPLLPPVLPDRSPIAAYGGYHKPATAPAVAHSQAVEHRCHEREFGGGMGCLCWAFWLRPRG